ncbi:phosphatases II [Lophiostoma macrostomum CBS 122681]|uniref:Phosphatases II n=1 Tax=Lophiostoma macrostomum CBS 122681 TaxID=1314788 RepID=A0A6A6TI62_9PLEO|nr:phosphatases II [Lophiostoma macrostomum CBS 122681]
MKLEDTAMSDSSASHKRHHEYTYRLPTPPRIVVPPPTLTTDIPQLNVGVRTDGPQDELDTSFLKDMNLESIVQRNTLLEWAYERRRQAQMVLPWLYLGPLTSARDREFLQREGITMVLAIRAREGSMSGAIQVGREVCEEVATIEAPDYLALARQFQQATKIINQHIAKVRKQTAASGNPQLGKVLVFCESGNEKSAAVVAAYLMEVLDNFDHIKAMQVCQAQRFCVNYDDSIKNILRSYWDILQARRFVAGLRSSTTLGMTPTTGSQPSSQLPRPTAASKTKRRIADTAGDDDVEMGDGMDPSDVLRFENRANTPFQDS